MASGNGTSKSGGLKVQGRKFAGKSGKVLPESGRLKQRNYKGKGGKNVERNN